MKVVVLSSGGIDSTTCLALAVDTYGKDNVVSLAFEYGQRHNKELEASKAVAEYYGVEHIVLNAEKLFSFSNNALMSHSLQNVPHSTYGEQTMKGIVSTNVPFRNGVMIACAASLAMSLTDDTACVYVGVHSDDYAGCAYADCSPEFIQLMSRAISYGTYGQVNLVVPFVYESKAEIVRRGLLLNVPYELTWSCYEGGDVHCGECATCIDRKKAFELNGETDPVGYKK